jgi:hypothetical protein
MLLLASPSGLMLQKALPGVPEYRRMPAALLRGWMVGKVGGHFNRPDPHMLTVMLGIPRSD